MRIESPRYTERFGSVRINDVQKVLELDSGKAKEAPLNIAAQKIEEAVINDFEEKMAQVLFVYKQIEQFRLMLILTLD